MPSLFDIVLYFFAALGVWHGILVPAYQRAKQSLIDEAKDKKLP